MGKNIVLFNNHTETFYDTRFDWQTGVQVLHLQGTENMRLGVVKYLKVIRIERETLSALAFFSWHWHDNIIKENHFAINEKEVNFYGWIETLWSSQWLGVQLRAPRECAAHCKQPNEGALSRRQIWGTHRHYFKIKVCPVPLVEWTSVNGSIVLLMQTASAMQGTIMLVTSQDDPPGFL